MQHSHSPRFRQTTRPALILLGWMLLMLPAAALYLAQVTLFPLIALDGMGAELLYWVTFSGTAPWGAITAATVAALGFYRLSKAQGARLLLALALSLGGGLMLNEYLKTCFDESRPNAEYLAERGLLDLDSFYAQPKSERRQEIITIMDAHPTALPPMSSAIEAHWRHEVGLSFPSGHTLFAVVVALTGCWFFIASGHWSTCIVLGGWALLMGFSRMLLGMHHSQDVLAATFIALPLAMTGIAASRLLPVSRP